MNDKNQNNGEDYVYKRIMLDKQHSRAWSVASVTVASLSIVFALSLPWLSIVLGVFAIAFALITRKNIGYFDGLSIAGIIVGIIGTVLGISGIILFKILEENSFIEEFLKDFEKLEEETGGEFIA